MPKSSSSLKKKRSKYLSPGRTKKKSKIKSKSKSKSKRTKSKKSRRHDDESDSYSDYESSSASVSSSSSEDSYKGRKSRSYARKEVKVTKKKSRARSSSSEGSHRLRKRKRSKRNDEYAGRKKISERSRKKKTRRDPSISSRSSGSRSYSTCQSESDSGEDSDYERRTKKSERRGGRRSLEKMKSRTSRKRYDTSSSSSYSGQNDGAGHWSEKEVNNEVTSKRLRSVIVFAREDNEERELDKDEHKEEMIYDHDDYPSSRSNDSNDRGIKGEFVQQSSFESEEKKHTVDNQEYYAGASNSKVIALPETDKDREGQNVESKSETDDRVRTDKYATNDSKNEFSGVIGSTDSELESILRRRALENLKRFRGGRQATIKRQVNAKNDSVSSSKLSLDTKTQSDQIRSSKTDGAVASMEGFTHSLLKDDNVSEIKNDDSESVSLESKLHPPDAGAGRANITVHTVHQRITRPRLAASALTQALSDAATIPREGASLQQSNKTEVVLGNSVHRGSELTSHIVNSPSDKTNLDKVSDVPLRQESFDTAVNPVEVTTLRESNRAIMATGSSICETGGQAVHVTPGSNNGETVNVENITSFGSVEPSHVGSAADLGSNKLEGEGKEDSQLQQKTMSVMRGGELVQVNYKVYIPKKAPALARRRLKR